MHFNRDIYLKCMNSSLPIKFWFLIIKVEEAYIRNRRKFEKKYLEKGFMFSPKVKYSLNENIQNFPQESKPTIATITPQRPAMEVGHSDPKCSAPEK